MDGTILNKKYDLVERVKALEEGGGGGLPDYSTEEQKTGQKWIDSKPIYRKVVVTGALPNATTKNVPHGIIGLDTVVKLYGVAKNTSDGGIYPLPQVLASENINLQVSLFIFEENISMKCTNDRSNFDESYVIIEYTKTT